MPDWMTMMPPVKKAVSVTMGTERLPILCMLQELRASMEGGTMSG
jgi:hypothetical protein